MPVRELTANGVTKRLHEWARDTGVPISTLHARISKGWTIERALSSPRTTIRKHGLSRPHRSTYNSWHGAKARCYNPNDPEYDNYGGRGITVCDAWLASFDTFLRNMGPRPAGHTLDRRDTNGHYTPDNCRWSTLVTQNNNKRTNFRIEAFGETRTSTEWARRSGIDAQVIRDRLKSGWTPERAIGGPLVNPQRIFTLDGVTDNLSGWSRRSGIHIMTLHARLKRGWALSDAISTKPRQVDRSARAYTANGETHTISEWAEISGLPRGLLKDRIRIGWTIERAIATPTLGPFGRVA